MKRTKAKTKTIAQLRQELTRQILEIALDDDNPQYKLDALKATVERGKAQNESPTSEPMDAMSVFQSRVRKAAETGPPDGADKQAETDC